MCKRAWLVFIVSQALEKQKSDVKACWTNLRLLGKIATYKQAALYRCVSLASGAALAMNARNILTSLLAARSLLETIAHFSDFVSQLARSVKTKDLATADILVMHRTFNTRDKEWLEEYPQYKAETVLKAIDKLEASFPSVRAIYEQLSEFCHPNWYGHHLLFSSLDDTTGTVAYSDFEQFPGIVTAVLPPLTLLIWFEMDIGKLDELVTEIATMQG